MNLFCLIHLHALSSLGALRNKVLHKLVKRCMFSSNIFLNQTYLIVVCLLLLRQKLSR